MPRVRSPERDEAFEIYKTHESNISLRDIAKELNVSEKTISGWKVKDKWDEKLNGVFGVLQTKIRSTPIKNQVAKKLINSVDDNEELTEKEKLFCFFYATEHNAAKAIRKAGYDTSTSSRQMGWSLLQKAKIQQEIKNLKKIRNETLLVDGSDIVAKYIEIAFADIGEFVSISCGGNIMTLKPFDDIDTSLISQISNTANGISIKLADKMKALDFLQKYFMLNPMDKHKKEYDEKRLKLEKDKLLLQGDEYVNASKDSKNPYSGLTTEELKMLANGE